MNRADRWRVFPRTVEDIRKRNADTDLVELQRIIDEAASEVRSKRRARSKADNVTRRSAPSSPAPRP